MIPDFNERVRRVTQAIPSGRVLSYGDVATLCGSPRAARAVGNVLRGTGGIDLPWHRVINAQGRISGKGDVYRADRQRRLLESEGVVFNASGALDMKALRWDTDGAPNFLSPQDDFHTPPEDWDDEPDPDEALHG